MLHSLAPFARALWQTIDRLRRAVLNLLFVVAILAAVAFLLMDRTPEMEPGSVLVVELRGSLVEESPEPDPTERLIRRFLPKLHRARAETRVADVVRVLRAAAHDPRIALVELYLAELQEADLAKLSALAAEIRLLRQHGKPVWVHADFYSQSHYLLASACDRVSVHPLGGVLLTGLGFYPLHIKDLLDMLRIDVLVLRAGTYKSAGEPFERRNMSEETRASIRAWLTPLWQTITEDIAASRHISAQQVQTYAEQLDVLVQRHGGDAAALALQERLVDAVETASAFHAALARHLGKEENDLPRVVLEDYAATLPAADTETRDIVALVRAQGPILPTAEGDNVVAADELIPRLHEAAADPRTRALVLRLDSPGGSALAAEDIRAALQAIRERGIPVVVSFGSLGASGAYWIATAATRILAEPMTLTGSIGVFATLPNLTRAAEAIGIISDGVGTTEFADQANPLRPMKPRTKASLEANLRHTYRRFQELVAQARGLDAPTVERLAQGQVWTGEEAKREGLVDAVGGVDLAVTMAAALAGMPQATAVEFRPKSQGLNRIAQLTSAQREAAIFPWDLPPATIRLARHLWRGGVFALAPEAMAPLLP